MSQTTKFERGEIDGAEPAREVWQSKGTFKQHKLTNFQNRYNLMKKEFEHKRVNV